MTSGGVTLWRISNADRRSTIGTLHTTQTLTRVNREAGADIQYFRFHAFNGWPSSLMLSSTSHPASQLFHFRLFEAATKVTAGEPIRTRNANSGLLGSFGTLFLFTVLMLLWPSAASSFFRSGFFFFFFIHGSAGTGGSQLPRTPLCSRGSGTLPPPSRFGVFATCCW